mgnify:CR=1 FL=1
MSKELERGNSVSKGVGKRNVQDDWHYDTATKMIDEWPSWKKEIYESNFSGKKVASCK